jgi:hypothetical protein
MTDLAVVVDQTQAEAVNNYSPLLRYSISLCSRKKDKLTSEKIEMKRLMAF